MIASAMLPEKKPDWFNRRSTRLPRYDYSQAGMYFVTICTNERKHLFGKIVRDEMRLSVLGRIARDSWVEIPRHFAAAQLDLFVIMPNHLHGIVVIQTRAQHAAPLRPGEMATGSLPVIVRAFKSAVTKRANEARAALGPVWQRSYYEHIIRSGEDLDELRRYIAENPARWAEDAENPAAGSGLAR